MKHEVCAKIRYPVDKSIFVGIYLKVDGKKWYVQFKFESVSLLCFSCGIWGHDHNSVLINKLLSHLIVVLLLLFMLND